jgi:hypothetical protein
MTDIAKKARKRWGRKYVDNRNWPAYNEQLVRRGMYYLDLDWVMSWDVELQSMNRNKRGRPYAFPNSLIQLQSVWHDKNMPVRMVEGITRRLFMMAELPYYNDYTTIHRRINQLSFKMDIPVGDDIMLFCDGSGFQAINGGEYLREKYGKKNRRWIQVIILGDPVTKEPVSFEVHLSPTSESESAKRQLRSFIDRDVDISKFGGDGAFDDRSLWRFLESNGIDAAIKPDVNARDDGPCRLRNRHVKMRNNAGYKRWARVNEYGRRWPATEGIFSAVKRMFGEHLAAKSERGMIQEASSKMFSYFVLKRYGEA